MPKVLYSIEQYDDPYCATYTNYVFLTKEDATEFSKRCEYFCCIARWEYDERLHCYKKCTEE